MAARHRRYDGDVPGKGGIALGHELGADSEFVVVFSILRKPSLLTQLLVTTVF